MVTLFSFTLCFRSRSRSRSRSSNWLRSGSSDWLRSWSFEGPVNYSLLLGSSSVPFCLLCFQDAQSSLALGIGLLKLFGLNSSFGLIFFGFGKLFLCVSGLISFL